MQQNYYYCCSLPLAAGSIVNPGNWGRIIKTYTPQTSPNAWLFIRELIFERVRSEHYPTKPSRFDSLFLCMNEEGIREFKKANGRSLDLMYEVTLVDAEPLTHVGDWTLFTMQNSDNYSSLTERAKTYWGGNNIKKPELATTSPVKIIKMVE